MDRGHAHHICLTVKKPCFTVVDIVLIHQFHIFEEPGQAAGSCADKAACFINEHHEISASLHAAGHSLHIAAESCLFHHLCQKTVDRHIRRPFPEGVYQAHKRAQLFPENRICRFSQICLHSFMEKPVFSPCCPNLCHFVIRKVSDTRSHEGAERQILLLIPDHFQKIKHRSDFQRLKVSA